MAAASTSSTFSLDCAQIRASLLTIESLDLPTWDTTDFRSEQITACVKSALKLLYVEGVPGKSGKEFGFHLIKTVHVDLDRVVMNNFAGIDPIRPCYTLAELTRAIAALKAALPGIEPPIVLEGIHNQRLNGLSTLTGDEWCIPTILGSPIVGRSHLEPILGKVPNMEVDSILRLCNHTMRSYHRRLEGSEQVTIIPNGLESLLEPIFPKVLISFIADFIFSWEIFSGTIYDNPFRNYAPKFELTSFTVKYWTIWENYAVLQKIEAAIASDTMQARAPKMEGVWIFSSPYGVIAHLKLSNPEEDVLLRVPAPNALVVSYSTQVMKQHSNHQTYIRLDAKDTIERFCIGFWEGEKELAPSINTSHFTTLSLVNDYKIFKEKGAPK